MTINYLMSLCLHGQATQEVFLFRFYTIFSHSYTIYSEYHIPCLNPLILEIPQKWHLCFLQTRFHILHLNQHMSKVVIFIK